MKILLLVASLVALSACGNTTPPAGPDTTPTATPDVPATATTTPEPTPEPSQALPPPPT